MVPIPAIALIGWNRQKHWSMNTKAIHALLQEATNQQIKDAILRNHSNLRTVSQHSNAYQQLHQKPDEALQTYNTRYTSYFNLAYPKLEIDNPFSRMHCIHYASSLYGKLSDEMTGRLTRIYPRTYTPQISNPASLPNRALMREESTMSTTYILQKDWKK